MDAVRSMGPPAGSPIAHVRRDCGISVPLSDGSSLWVFCDTTSFDGDGGLEWFVQNSAPVIEAADRGAAREADHVEVAEPLTAEGRPYDLLAPTGAHPACPPGTDQRFLWPESAVAVPDGAAQDRVWIFVGEVCVTDMTPVALATGLAELVVPLPLDPQEPRQARMVAHDLFPAGDGFRFGQAAVVDGSTVYVYGCVHGLESCGLARVPDDRVPDRSAYEYWTAGEWTDDPAAAAELPMPEGGFVIKPSVGWLPDLDRYAWVASTVTGGLRVRFSTDPAGPWSYPAQLSLPGCGRPYPDNCFAAEVHPWLSGGDRLTITYFDPGQESPAPPTRVVDLEVRGLGRPPAGPLAPPSGSGR